MELMYTYRNLEIACNKLILVKPGFKTFLDNLDNWDDW